jgi:hypothetical protein
MKSYAESKDEYGEVTLGDITVALTMQAYCNNYGTDGGVRYYARAVDTGGATYRVTWDTSIDWDTHVCDEDQQQDSQGQDIPLSCTWCEDENNTCDWDNPTSIEPID